MTNSQNYCRHLESLDPQKPYDPEAKYTPGEILGKFRCIATDKPCLALILDCYLSFQINHREKCPGFYVDEGDAMDIRSIVKDRNHHPTPNGNH
jgi:hypothetical protein